MFVIIIEPGTFEFTKPSFLFKESAGKAVIPVHRVNGADGKVELQWKTEDMTAATGKDYEGGESTLAFDHGETMKSIEITIYDDQVCIAPYRFRLLLFNYKQRHAVTEPRINISIGGYKGAFFVQSISLLNIASLNC